MRQRDSQAEEREHGQTLKTDAIASDADTDVTRTSSNPRDESTAALAHDFDPAAQRASTLELPPGSPIGRYLVIERLGSGGMGVVYAAYDRDLDRRVALKLLRTDRSRHDSARQRLMREAQALARLSHPNVVVVHDVGELATELFLAMEYVEGTTLQDWGQQAERPWAEVLAVYLAAGDGLIAAHRVGIIHRDFKPANVILGKDGRVRVLDFGLAAAVGEQASSAPPSGETMPRTTSLDTSLTATGALMGTPAYMAPEQHAGMAADERTDQFSFCASLYEALYGERPFAGHDLFVLARLKREGKISPPPAGTQVPAWVRTVLVRGLAARPEDRWPTMMALLKALRDDPTVKQRKRRNTALISAAAAGLVGLAVLGWLRQPARQADGPCQSTAQALAGVWDEEVAAQVQQAFAATGRPYAAVTYERVTGILDRYAADWQAMHAQACEPTEVHRDQPAHVLALRLACLERRRSQLSALTEVFAKSADMDVVEKGIEAAQALDPIAYCGDTEALLAAVPPPEDPAVRVQVKALEERLDHADALYEAGKYRAALDTATAVLEETRSVAYPPIGAKALHRVAQVRVELGEVAQAEEQLGEALLAAARARDDALLGEVWRDLQNALSNQARHREVLQLELAALAAAERTGDELHRAEVLQNLGVALDGMARYEEAQARYVESLAVHERILGPDDIEVALLLNNLAMSLQKTGKYAEARARYDRALRIWERSHGPEHPYKAILLHNVASMLQDMGEYEEARAHYEHALRVGEQGWGPEHTRVANTLNNLGVLLQRMGKREEARAHFERALAIQETVYGAEHPEMASSLNNLGNLAQDAGKHDEARAYLERSIAMREKLAGPTHPDLTPPLNNLGGLLYNTGKLEEARPYFERALAIQEQALGPEHPGVATYLNNLGNLLRAMGDFTRARGLLERSIAIREKVLDPEHPDLAIPLSNLGVVLMELGEHDEARAYFERSIAIVEKRLGPKHAYVAYALTNLGKLMVREGKAREALPLLERAVAVRQAAGVGPTQLAKSQFVLATALWDSGRGRDRRTIELVARAREVFANANSSQELQETDRWLAEHRAR